MSDLKDNLKESVVVFGMRFKGLDVSNTASLGHQPMQHSVGNGRTRAKVANGSGPEGGGAVVCVCVWDGA